ncbi:MAG: carboxymuconolactone decarboxylase family protein [Acidobacteriota bacterium]
MLSPRAAAKAAAQVGLPELKTAASIYRVLLHQPRLARQINDLFETLLMECDLDARLRELVVLRIGWTNEGVYEWTQHWRIAQQIGIEECDLLAVRDWREHGHWSREDTAALRATDEILAEGVISPETWALCCETLPSDRQRLELVVTIGTWKMISDLLKCLEVPLEDGLEPWPPHGESPASLAHSA